MERRKKREEVEARYVSEFVAKYFKGEILRSWIQPPVGDRHHVLAAKTMLPVKYFWRYGRRPDAIVLTRRDINVIEAESRRPVNALNELELYRRLFPITPEFKPYLRYPQNYILVSPLWVSDVADLCRVKGILYILYRPKWVIESLMRWGVLVGGEEVVDIGPRG